MVVRPRHTATVLIAASSLTVAGCGGGDGGNSPPTSRAGNPIPTRIPPKATPVPGVTLPDGSPRVTQFKAPSQFWCLPDYPNRAQLTIGWHVPSATSVSLWLDGRRLATGFRPSLPFQLPAGGPNAVGATVVFPCRPGNRRRIRIQWRIKNSPATTRVVEARKAP